MSQWDALYKKTRSAPPRKLLVEALVYVSHNGSVLQALDLGAGSLLNTKYLLNKGYFVTAVDSNKSVMEGFESSNLNKIISHFETFSFPESYYDIIVATFSSPFCNSSDFNRVIHSLKQSLKKRRYHVL